METIEWIEKKKRYMMKFRSITPEEEGGNKEEWDTNTEKEWDTTREWDTVDTDSSL